MDSTKVLFYQLQHNSSAELYLKSTTTETLSHPMNVEIDREVFTASENYIDERNDRNQFWKSRAFNEIDFDVVCLQLFSDKSHMALSAASIVVYPLHSALLKFSN